MNYEKSEKYEVLKRYFGYDSFREGQEILIDGILDGRDVLGIMPTGSGKSLCYQVPALIPPGITLVVSPLISLMKDQVTALNQAGVHAAYLNSSLTTAQYYKALGYAREGRYPIIYVAPERLMTEAFLDFAMHVDIAMLAIDEAHCISQWGQDFRPSYLKIVDFIERLPRRPVVSAFTATATKEVRDDIIDILQLQNPVMLTTGFDRKNLYFAVETPKDRYAAIRAYLEAHPGQGGIIYCLTRRNVEEICEKLIRDGFSVTRYHAGLSDAERQKNQDDFIYDRVPVMVATNAFGMGIDKPDVRLVLHADFPDSPEAYFQEAGRAGRDGQKAYAVLLYAQNDKVLLKKRIADTFPEKEYIRKVYEDINYYYQMAMGDGLGCTYAFNIDEFCQNFKHFPIQVDSALKILTRAGYLEYTDEQDNASRLIFTLNRDELYRIHENNEDTEKLLRTILRSYTGLFTDYAYINEDTLALRSGLNRQQVYDTLIALSKRRILNYIPGKKTPYIVYTRERQETRRIVLSREVYEDRKESYIRRINAMLEYADAEDKCRSRMLLYYFGERNEHNCGQCDVCITRHKSHKQTEDLQEMIQKILSLLNEGPLSVHEVADRLYDQKELAMQALSYLQAEEKIVQKSGKLFPA